MVIKRLVLPVAGMVAVYFAWYLYQANWAIQLLPPDAVLPDNSRYYGDIHDGYFHGQGKWVGADGAHYEGGFKRGLMHGKGDYRDGTGTRYIGEFAAGLRSGNGAIEWEDGSRYKGEFSQNRMHGTGAYTGFDDESYTGVFAEGKIQRGSYSSADGTISYIGEFDEWLFHGRGVYQLSYGDRYEGTFERGMLTGKGRASLRDGSLYEGDFAGWAYVGVGVLTDSNGNRYEGEFEYGMYHGEGELFLSEPMGDIESVKGTWEHGSLRDDPRNKLADHGAAIEQLLYTQNQLIDNAVDNVAMHNPDKIDLFFVGLAGYSAQDVFLKELRFIEGMFSDNGDAKGRTVSLINHYDTVADTPLATKTALKRVLHGIAEKMDLENDILFLYLTSHGSSDHQFSIRLDGVKLPAIGKQDLAEVLNDSSIKWKVVVVSACYSGGFLPLLQSENSLAMTAARHDRRSFGCSDESEMTYFAKAYFKEALPRSNSFASAFEEAKRTIKEWEEVDFPDSPHSEPQMWVGDAIEKHLHKWRAERPADLR